MILQDYLSKLNQSDQIAICNSNDWFKDPKTTAKVYNTFFNGAVCEVPEELLKRTVVKKFKAFLWNSTTFVLRAENE